MGLKISVSGRKNNYADADAPVLRLPAVIEDSRMGVEQSVNNIVISAPLCFVVFNLRGEIHA